jgi:DNA modification methylase
VEYVSRVEIIGDATLYLGDCRDILPTLGPVDAVVTSPPYAQQRDYGAKIDDWRGLMAQAIGPTPDAGATQILVNLGLIHKDGRVLRYWDGFIEDMEAVGWRHFGWYVWDQGAGQAGDWNGRLGPSHEFVFHFNREARKPNKTKRTLGGKIHGPNIRAADGTAAPKTGQGDVVQPFKIPDSVIRAPRETAGGWEAAHPARYSVPFARDLVEAYTAPHDVVLDPFMGSGTTGVVCANLGRRFIGCEIEPAYFDIACRRIAEAYRQPRLFDEPAPKPVQPSLLGDAA